MSSVRFTLIGGMQLITTELTKQPSPAFNEWFLQKQYDPDQYAPEWEEGLYRITHACKQWHTPDEVLNRMLDVICKAVYSPDVNCTRLRDFDVDDIDGNATKLVPYLNLYDPEYPQELPFLWLATYMSDLLYGPAYSAKIGRELELYRNYLTPYLEQSGADTVELYNVLTVYFNAAAQLYTGVVFD